jgi:hypothetical protein
MFLSNFPGSLDCDADLVKPLNLFSISGVRIGLFASTSNNF